ncbi:MAG: DivIVA domain-containing protein [Bdellovibrio sp.]|nr:MAG: DivIVA domain-containing protein [Bdellovibrio sp.]
MKIAPIDIAHKTFSRKMMGFDPEEVMEFLRMVADEMESIIRDRNQLRETLREKELSIIEYRERDELLKNTITTATKMSDKIQADAEREARLILSDANQKAETIVRDARDSLKKIYQEIADLKKVRMQFENNLRALVQSHLTMLEQGHRVMPDPELPGEIRESGFQEAPSPSSEDSEIKAKVKEALQKTLEP